MGNMHPLTKWVIDRIEKDYKDDIALLLDQATILYARSEEDAARFEDCRKRMNANLNDDTFVYGKALEYLDKAPHPLVLR